jgi:hypothetical protein
MYTDQLSCILNEGLWSALFDTLKGVMNVRMSVELLFPLPHSPPPPKLRTQCGQTQPVQNIGLSGQIPFHAIFAGLYSITKLRYDSSVSVQYTLKIHGYEE